MLSFGVGNDISLESTGTSCSSLAVVQIEHHSIKLVKRFRSKGYIYS